MDHIFSHLFENKKRFFLVLLALTVFLRISSLYQTFLDIDESQFAGFAHVLMDGGLPYVDSLDTKPPFIYLFYWFCFALFGKYSMTGVHLVGILWTFWTAVILYKIGKENENEAAGFWAALFYTIFSTTHLPKFIATSITSVMILPLALAILYWMRGEKKLLLTYDLLAGLFTGIAFLFKYQAGIQIVVFFFFLLPFFPFREKSIKILIMRYGIYLIGFFVPIGITLFALYQIGVLSDFYNWSLIGSFHYIDAGRQTISFFQNLLLRGSVFVLFTFLLWYLLIKFLFPLISRGSSSRLSLLINNPYVTLLLLWFLFSLVPVCVGGRFYGHYFIQLLPPLCLIAGSMATQLTSARALKWMGIALIIPALFSWSLRVDQERIYALFPDDQLFEQEEIGEWFRENTKPDQTLFVWGFATAIYFHAERKPISRFLWTDLLTGKVPGSEKANNPNFDTQTFTRPEAWKAFWKDFRSNPPTYFVDTSTANIHNYKKYPLINYTELFHYVRRNYDFLKNVGGCLIYKRK